ASELGSTAGVKAKDKGKAIMQESESSKKIKKRVQVQMSADEELAKKVFEEEHVVWDQNQAFVPKDSEIEKEVIKRSGFDLQQEFVKKDEASSFVQKQPTRGSRKKSLARKRARETLSEESAKKQKLEDDTEKEEFQVYLNIVLEDESLDIESLATKQDVLELYRLVKERFQTASPEDTLSKMLSRRLEVDHQSEMGYELIRYMHVAMNNDSSRISCTNHREYLQGLAAALAILITRASQSRQHGMSEPARQSLTD
ncbi:hypothetical protein Tco_0817277, partial [Tanacetum coccineum]